MRRREIYIVDANVLIDFLKVDETLLRLVVKHLGDVRVPMRIAEEVHMEVNWDELGVTIQMEDIQLLLRARANVGSLSYPDRVVLLLTRGTDWICVTNDLPLRKALDEAEVAIKWSLQLLLDLVNAGGLTVSAAILAAEAMAAVNVRLTQKVIEEFRRKVIG